VVRRLQLPANASFELAQCALALRGAVVAFEEREQLEDRAQ